MVHSLAIIHFKKVRIFYTESYFGTKKTHTVQKFKAFPSLKIGPWRGSNIEAFENGRELM